jgi:long-chain acyl-CoA synthetase
MLREHREPIGGSVYPGHWAKEKPDTAAVVMAGSGEMRTWRELDDRSNRLAQFWWAAGLRPGDHVAIFSDNRREYFDVAWAALRSGLYLTTVNRYLTGEEAAYIVDDCGARALVVSASLAEVAAGLAELAPNAELRHAFGGAVDGYDDFEDAIAAFPAEPLEVEPAGDFMLYSSGTTGRPKGIKRPLSGRSVAEPNPLTGLLMLWGFDADTVYLSPAPLYHSAPLGFTLTTHALGGTTVIMEKFDPEAALAAIERHRVTHSQWVPTMFSRMLKMPADARDRHDLSSHRIAIHAAAPCPVEVKRQMIEWWGPILHEYYGGTELNGLTIVNSDEWLAHPGTVGRPVIGTLHVCDDDGNELPPGEVGLVYFEQPVMPFAYHNDPDKTRRAQHPQHENWSKLGDVGYVDDEGYLYLTDRKDFMIISGGVNIYPQEIEDVLVMHPKVGDVAVFGVPNEEMGEEVKAVVEPAHGVSPGAELERELMAYAREHLAHYKCPRSLEFVEEMPRLPTGKLYKRLLRDPYWGNTTSRIV